MAFYTDKPSSKADLGGFIKVLTERLTKRGANNVGIGIVGISNVIKKLRDSHESSVRILTPIKLTPLSSEESKEVVIKGLKEADEQNGFETSIDDNALSMIAHVSEGYPHFIQQYAYSSFEQDNDKKIDVMDVIKGLTDENGALHLLGMRYFENMYTEEVRSDDYRTVLQIIAQHTGYVQRKIIIEESGLKRHTVDNALAALKKRGSLVAKSGQKGLYKLPSRSFATWINAFKITHDKIKQAERIRIDCVSAANHNLIRLLDKPGVSAYSVYKEISFFELGVGSAFSRSALFSRRGSALTCKQATKK